MPDVPLGQETDVDFAALLVNVNFGRHLQAGFRTHREDHLAHVGFAELDRDASAQANADHAEHVTIIIPRAWRAFLRASTVALKGFGDSTTRSPLQTTPAQAQATSRARVSLFRKSFRHSDLLSGRLGPRDAASADRPPIPRTGSGVPAGTGRIVYPYGYNGLT